MKVYLLRFYVIAIFLAMSFTANANKSYELYVGQSTFVSCPDPPRGSIFQTSWTSRHGSVSVIKDGTYGAKIKVTSYFSGTAQVQCDYYWRWYVGTRQYTNHATTYYNVTCKQVSIRMNQGEPITLSSGEGIALSVTLSPSISPSPKVTWSSSNSNIAEVNQNGYVWAKQEGTAVISASSNAGSDKASVTINVQGVEVERAELSPSSVNMLIDETSRLTLTTYPQYSKAESTSWHSRNPSVASVNSSGTFTGNSLGTTSVYCVVNGYISSNEVRVKVSKPQLTLSADKKSGLYEKGTTVALDASKHGATIYYTLDGSTPTRKSNVYREPICLKENTVLKAFAVRDDCIDSEVLSREYKVTSLQVLDTYPEKGVEVFRPHLVPTVNFTDNIQLIDEGKGITLKNGNSEISGTVVAFGKSLSFVPDMDLKEGSYTLTIPQQVIMTASQEENFAYTFSFGIKEKSYGIIDICAGNQFSQVLKEDGTLWAWGRNDVGSIGNGTKNYFVISPVKVLENVVYTEAGLTTSAAITESGSLYMWGYNGFGQLGNESVKDSKKPIYLWSGAEKVVTSGKHTLALTDNGYLYSCGHNWYGELGIGKQTQYEWEFHYVMKNVKDIAADNYSTLIVTNDNELYTCGAGYKGQLGNGYITSYYSTPHKVMDNVKKVASSFDASLVLKNDGTLWSFGSNDFGQLGISEDIEYSLEPQKVLSDVKDIDACSGTCAAIKTDNSLWLWGDNYYGQIGNGTKEKQKTPIKILSDVKKVSVGGCHVLALTTKGKLYGWGDNQCREIADYNKEFLSPLLCSYFPIPVSPESLCLKSQKIKPAESVVLVPSISPVNAEYLAIEWSSSNPFVAAVSDFGEVVGISEGSSTINCKMYDVTGGVIEASCEVTVVKDGNIEDGIDGVIINNSENVKSAPIYYNLQGIRIKNLGKGIYIKIQDGKKQKIHQ